MVDDFVEPDVFDPAAAQAVEDRLYEDRKNYDGDVAAHVRRAQTAYARVFVSGNATADDVDFVMRDLAWFCAAYDPQWRTDPREQDRVVARREVFQRIVEYTGLSHDTLMKRYAETQT